MPNVVHLSADQRKGTDAKLADALDELPQPFAYFDSENRLTACNRAFRCAFPTVAEKHFVKRVGESCLDDESWLWRDSREQNSGPSNPTFAERAEQFNAHMGGRPANMLPRLHPDRDGGTLISFEDVGPQIDLENHYLRIVAKLRSELAEAVHSRGASPVKRNGEIDIVAATSHEMRTPLNAIIGFSEMMKGEVFGPLDNDHYREYARIIHESGIRLLSLVNDILDISKINAGKLALNCTNVQILRVIVGCMREVEPQARKARICITVQIHDGVTGLFGDEKRLHQMILNLLSNAIKYTPAGGEVSIEVCRRSDEVCVSVLDTGIGMKEEDIQSVLEPFNQVDCPPNAKHTGTGLGLPLTSELAELHGGRLIIESTVDVGTTATLLLPYRGRCDRPVPGREPL
jgi:signal transduction histidine kinase